MTRQRITNEIRSALEEGIETMMGEAAERTEARLPTERELAERFQVSRHAIRQALERLEAKGSLWRHVGRGTFRGRRSEAEQVVADVAAFCSPRHIYDARRMLEPSLASMAALNATSSQIAEIQATCRRCAAARNMDDYEVFDEAFHRAIAQACGNPLAAELFETVNQARKKIIWGAMRRAVLRPERRAFFSEQHREIMDAIARRDAHAAWQAVMSHMETVAQTYETLRPGEPFIV
ncbi:MAG: FadR family transcriptional regulator [Bosea sp.]|uniref:FadR/GntR family transcriptional regulator n=1 Tax=Bosea sp. (in: a-proteobacteria) TaxID=1871050 RepID=UPI00239AE29E|nr:FadR family transcriptional regulator [Bosea sp. (in: a-proteobacteria)]MCP4740294.1 FadR family transcriptional regulator [Bosea sp. (in: a-proteobacteria)]